MQMYLVMLLGYYAFTSMTGRSSRKSSNSDTTSTQDAAEFDEDAEVTPAALGQLGRQFTETQGIWLSYLQLHSKSDTTLLFLHRTSLSAEAEYGALLPQLVKVAPLRFLAPDRPCHGYSMCPAGGEPADAAWINALLAARPAPKRLALVASGREAAGQALALARRRPEVKQIWLLSPNVAAPVATNMTTSGELRAWLEVQQGVPTAQAAVDAARWAILGGAARISAELSVAKLPKGCKVTVIYGEQDKEDEALSVAFESHRVTANVRNLVVDETVSDALVDEVQQMTGDPDSPATEEE